MRGALCYQQLNSGNVGTNSAYVKREAAESVPWDLRCSVALPQFHKLRMLVLVLPKLAYLNFILHVNILLC